MEIDQTGSMTIRLLYGTKRNVRCAAAPTMPAVCARAIPEAATPAPSVKAARRPMGALLVGMLVPSRIMARKRPRGAILYRGPGALTAGASARSSDFRRAGGFAQFQRRTRRIDLD